MRLFVAAVIVVAAFIIATLLISRLFPYGAGWAGVCVATTCLYASAFGAWVLLGNNPGMNVRLVQGGSVQEHRLRNNLLYFAAAMAVVTIAMVVLIHDTDRGIHRSFKNDWFVGFGSAFLALGYAAKAFWIFRGNWRIWAVIGVLFALFTATTVPMLSQMEKVPLLFMGPLANIELLIALVLLNWFIDKQSPRHGSVAP
jgi:magnesium-transporting ATPase (P-type)